MGMFDIYKPSAETACPVCATPLQEWQGKDGPCALFIWAEGVSNPIEQAIDDEEVKLTPEDRENHVLPETFVIYLGKSDTHRFLGKRRVIRSPPRPETAYTTGKVGHPSILGKTSSYPQ